MVRILIVIWECGPLVLKRLGTTGLDFCNRHFNFLKLIVKRVGVLLCSPQDTWVCGSDVVHRGSSTLLSDTRLTRVAKSHVLTHGGDHIYHIFV